MSWRSCSCSSRRSRSAASSARGPRSPTSPPPGAGALTSSRSRWRSACSHWQSEPPWRSPPFSTGSSSYQRWASKRPPSRRRAASPPGAPSCRSSTSCSRSARRSARGARPPGRRSRSLSCSSRRSPNCSREHCGAPSSRSCPPRRSTRCPARPGSAARSTRGPRGARRPRRLGAASRRVRGLEVPEDGRVKRRRSPRPARSQPMWKYCSTRSSTLTRDSARSSRRCSSPRATSWCAHASMRPLGNTPPAS